MSRRKRRLQRSRKRTSESSPPESPEVISQEPDLIQSESPLQDQAPTPPEAAPPGSPSPEPEEIPAEEKPEKPELGHFIKMLAQMDPKMVADGLNEMFKRVGQDVNLTPEEVLFADFKFDGDSLMVGRPIIPEVDATQLGAMIAQTAPLFAQRERPPITPEKLREDIETFADAGTQFMIEDHGHSTMLFPFLYGGPLAAMVLADVNLNDPQEGFYHAARMRVESFPEALEGFILIAQTWTVATLLHEPHSVGPLSKHPQRRQSLIVAGAHANGWRYTICVIFDEKWDVIGRITSDNRGMVIASDKIIDTLARACFETDTEKLNRYIQDHQARRKGKPAKR